MEESTRANGRIIKWKEEGHSNGLMAVDTKENTLMTRKRDKELSTGKVYTYNIHIRPDGR